MRQRDEIQEMVDKLEKVIAKPVYASKMEDAAKPKTADSKKLNKLAENIRHIIGDSQDYAESQSHS